MSWRWVRSEWCSAAETTAGRQSSRHWRSSIWWSLILWHSCARSLNGWLVVNANDRTLSSYKIVTWKQCSPLVADHHYCRSFCRWRTYIVRRDKNTQRTEPTLAVRTAASQLKWSSRRRLVLQHYSLPDIRYYSWEESVVANESVVLTGIWRAMYVILHRPTKFHPDRNTRGSFMTSCPCFKMADIESQIYFRLLLMMALV